MAVTADYFGLELDRITHGSTLALVERAARESRRIIGTRVITERWKATHHNGGYDDDIENGIVRVGSTDEYYFDVITTLPIYSESWANILFLNTVQQPQNPVRLEEFTAREHITVMTAFMDAINVFASDKNCQGFFTQGNATPEQVKNIQNQLSTLRDNAQFDPNARGLASVNPSNNTVIKIGSTFFINDGSRYGTQKPYDWNPYRGRYEDLNGLVPRQSRAATILHELAHILGLIPDDSIKAAGANSGLQSLKNDKTISEKCGKGLRRLPLR